MSSCCSDGSCSACVARRKAVEAYIASLLRHEMRPRYGTVTPGAGAAIRQYPHPLPAVLLADALKRNKAIRDRVEAGKLLKFKNGD